MKRALVVFCLLIPAMAAAQSLGEVAKKEKKRREKNQEKGVKVRVIREEAISKGKPERSEGDVGAAEASAASRPEDNGGSATSSSTPDRRKQEIEWRRRASEARARLKAAKERYDTLAGLHLAAGEYYVDEKGNPAITSLDQLRRMVTEAKAELDEATKALEELHEEARRAGVPPGWLR